MICVYFYLSSSFVSFLTLSSKVRVMLFSILSLFCSPEQRKSPQQRAVYEFLRGKILDVFPDYNKEAEDHLSKAVCSPRLNNFLYSFSLVQKLKLLMLLLDTLGKAESISCRCVAMFGKLHLEEGGSGISKELLCISTE